MQWVDTLVTPYTAMPRPSHIDGPTVVNPDDGSEQQVQIYAPTDEQLKTSGWYPAVYEDLIELQEFGSPVLDEPNKQVIWPAEDMPLEEARQIKADSISLSKWTTVVAGTLHDLGGNDVVFVKTDLESQGMLTAAWSKAKADANYTIDSWKFVDAGTGGQAWRSLTNAQIIALGDEVEAHVQAQFDLEKPKQQAIAAASTVAELRLITWE